MNKPVIDGFVFQYAKDTERAKREYETLRKVKEKINIEDMESTLRIYEKLVSKRYFETPVGLSFLRDMRSYLVESMPDREITPVYVPGASSDGEKNPLKNLDYEKIKKENEKLLAIKKKMTIALISMIIVIIGMVFIVVTNENIGYFNAEEKVLNKYSAWQERLENWEKELIEREDELDKREEELQ